MSPAAVIGERVPARITVVGGVNGSGKSSLMGSLLLEKGVNYFNPDVFTRQLKKLDPSLSLEQANAAAWNFGKEQLETAIAMKTAYAFETTLGGQTISRLLKEAAQSGLEVAMWYCGLDQPERNLQRVAARVAKGGHDIPEEKIRARWRSSRENLIRLLPFLTELKVFDNSVDASEETGFAPSPTLLLQLKNGAILHRNAAPPEWAKPIIVAALLNAGEV